jgi:hypothetical protein
VLAAAAGFSVAKPYPDISGIDLQIDGTNGMTNGIPLARAQVKSWSDPQGNDHSLRYRGLNEKQFNALAERRTPVPVFLFLVVVPPDVHDFTHADPWRLRLSHAAYWVSLADRPQIPDPDPSRKVSVHVPRQNLLTVESLTALCEGPVALPSQAADPSTLAGTP